MSTSSTTPGNPFVGKWRIIEADLWDKDYLDLVEKAYIQFSNEGLGDFAFGAVTGSIDCHYSKYSVFFTWAGNDEMDAASGSGKAKIESNGTLTINLRFHLGDEAQLKAIKS